MRGASWVATSFLEAVRFLTVLPLPGPRAEEAFQRSPAFFPLVGVLLGLVLGGLDLLLIQALPTVLTSVFTVVAWVVLTGALHLDGWMDTCDGLLGGRTPEERLRILREASVGAFGVAGGILLLLAKVLALSALSGPARWAGLVMAASTGRWAMTFALESFPYARPEGTGQALARRQVPGVVALASATALLVALALVGWWGLLLFAGVVGLAWASARWMCRRLGGLTGDTYGALCEGAEAVVLVGLVLLGGERALWWR